MFKTILKKIVSTSLLTQYHRLLAISANFFYGQPSEKLIVIGVTGTNGKTTTVSLIAKVLETAGYKVGVASTAIFKIAEKEWLNDKKMTMLGRFELQKLLKQMTTAGCNYAVIETSSQGIEQFRHLGVNYDVVVFTNLTPEHIEAHGGFKNYRQAKEKLFAKLQQEKIKQFDGQTISKIITANINDRYVGHFMKHWSNKKIGYGLAGQEQYYEVKEKIIASDIEYRDNGTKLFINDVEFNTKMFGQFNVYNSLAAISVALSQKIGLRTCKVALEKVKNVPGRMEFIATDKDFKVLVDYAPEPESVTQLYQTIKDHQVVSGKIIHVLGSCGGGRDIARRPVLGKLAAKNADCIIVTNEDPYDDDPREIINEVAQGAIDQGKELDKDLFKIFDRREAIKKALSLARDGDLVLLTGKGCEQAICLAEGKKIKWDEREVVREELKKMKR